MKINKFFIKILIVYFFIFNLTHCLISAQEFNDVILSKQGKTYICKIVKKDSANIYFDFKPRDTVI